jgi:hypothetical protein
LGNGWRAVAERGLLYTPVRTLIALVIGVTVLVVSVWSTSAAIELEYYRATATNSSVLLEWATFREYNLAGFEIMCKRTQEPETSYHPIGSRIAQGGPDRSAQYSFNITTGLVPGQTYCFRLREVTTDGTPGEVFDLCGYGPGITPTPGPELGGAGILTPVAPDGTPTPIIIGGPQDQDAAQATLTAIALEPTPTPIGFSPLDATPTPTQPISPLGSIELDATNTAIAAAVAQQQSIFEETPTPTETLTETFPQEMPTETPTEFIDPFGPSPLDVPTETPTPTETLAGEAFPTETPTDTEMPRDKDQPKAQGAPAGVEEATPTPLFVVVTATPTEVALAAAPTFTPWPTATPTPPFTLVNLLAPNSQNLMVMLLCLIFLSATGLGTLGLVTSIVYMRSQSNRDRMLERLYRRRYY